MGAHAPRQRRQTGAGGGMGAAGCNNEINYGAADMNALRSKGLPLLKCWGRHRQDERPWRTHRKGGGGGATQGQC